MDKRFDMRSLKDRPIKAHTLIEMMLIIFIIGFSFMFTKVGVRMMNDIMQGRAMAETDRDAQVFLFTISQEIRSSAKLLHVSSSTLQMAVFNTRFGFDPVHFNPANIATMTYRYVMNPGTSYIQKTVLANDVLVADKKIFTNKLLPFDDLNYSSNYVFIPCSADTCAFGLPNVEAVEITLRTSPLYVAGNQKNYTVRAMRRGKSL